MRSMIQTRIVIAGRSQLQIRSRKVASGGYSPEHDLEVVQAQWERVGGGRGTPVIDVEGSSRVGGS